MHSKKVGRILLTDLVAIAAVLVTDLVAKSSWHIPFGIVPMQLLAVLLLQFSLLYVLANDKKLHKSRPHKHLSLEIVGYGLLSALVAYGGFLLLFATHTLNPAYIDTNHPLYIEATTIAYFTLALCQHINLLMVGVDGSKTSWLQQIQKDKNLRQALLLALFISLNVVYNPLFQPAFQTGPLSVLGWLIIIICTATYTTSRLAHRHTKKHSRKAVLKLHRQVHTAKSK